MTKTAESPESRYLRNLADEVPSPLRAGRLRACADYIDRILERLDPKRQQQEAARQPTNGWYPYPEYEPHPNAHGRYLCVVVTGDGREVRLCSWVGGAWTSIQDPEGGTPSFVWAFKLLTLGYPQPPNSREQSSMCMHALDRSFIQHDEVAFSWRMAPIVVSPDGEPVFSGRRGIQP